MLKGNIESDDYFSDILINVRELKKLAKIKNLEMKKL